MIERYSTPEMEKIWSERGKYKRWIEIEKTVNDVLQEQKVIPSNDLSIHFDKLLDRYVSFVIHDSKELEKEIHHDVNAFVFTLENFISKADSDGRFIHYGLTSSDIVDTGNAIAIRDSLDILHKSYNKLRLIFFDELPKKVDGTKIMGRTHGQHAEPILLKRMFRVFAQDMVNHEYHLCDDIVCGKISGAVGDNKYISRSNEVDILCRLGLRYCETTQVVPRESYARLIANMALLASSLEKMVLQIRLHQQSGIEEIYEPFDKKQTGSSAMPTKRNPILCENISGLARIMRSYVQPAMENISLWDQRDISHSSVERIIFPDAFNLLHFMLKRVIYIFENIEFNFDNINKNLEKYSDSQGKLLELIREGKGRQEAYRIVQGKEND